MNKFVLKTQVYKCQCKHRYETQAQARRFAAATMLHSSEKPGQPFYVYRCPICKGWHFTTHVGVKSWERFRKQDEELERMFPDEV